MFLSTPISQLTKIGKITANKFKKLGIEKAEDLLFYFPFRYDDLSQIVSINNLQANSVVTIKASIELISNKRSPIKKTIITETLVSDQTGSVKIIWFNQPFLTKALKPGDEVYFSGKIENDFYGLQMTSPSYEKVSSWKKETIHTGRLVPIYSATENLTQKQIRFLIKFIIHLTKEIKEWLPEEIKKDLNFFDLADALRQIHFPDSKEKLEKAQERLKFDELFLIQIQTQLLKKNLEKNIAPKIHFKEEKTKTFVLSLPFKLTNAQKKSAWQILKDLEKDKPMNRLLEGEVGSGKTIVATMAMLNVFLNNYQSALMAPTEILAQQHYNNICQLLANFNVKIGLITRSQIQTNADLTLTNTEKKISKNKILRLIKDGELQIIIGTHSLIQEDIYFNNLALAIIDEQHRFGVEQRSALIRTNTDLIQTDVKKEAVATEETNGDLLYEELTYKIRGAIFNIKKQLKLGHKEVIYQKALEYEFEKIKLSFEKEKSIEIKYDNKKVGIYRPDFIIEDKVILEIKKLPFIGKFEKEQAWHYLKGSNYKLALLVNFAQDDVQIERFINAKQNTSPHKSALVRISPHLLSMTATPIPRSLALALYGDLDLSIIDELPEQRKKIITKIVDPQNRQKAYDFIKNEIKKGRQIFVLCPLINESDKLGVKSATAEYEKLKKEIFPDFKIGLMHGKLKPKEKEKTMQAFLKNEINILVSTSVIEVGIDIPNASVMMIEGAERFGLAQLYQFRGRVGRSEHQSFCFLFSETAGTKTKERLQALITAKNSFELAEKDLEIRGPGELYVLAKSSSTQQSGYLSFLKIARLTDHLIIQNAKNWAKKILDQDQELKNYPELKNKIICQQSISE